MQRIPVLLGLLVLAGCASPPPASCPPGSQAMVNELIYFGTATPDGVVAADAWTQFLANGVTPRFPQGLTVWPAAGQWRAADGTIGGEASYLLNVVHADDTASENAVREITEAYKSQFRQEAVLRVRTPVCASF